MCCEGFGEELQSELQPSMVANRWVKPCGRSHCGWTQWKTWEHLHMQSSDLQQKAYWKSEPEARDLLCSHRWKRARQSFIRALGGLLPLLCPGDGDKSCPCHKSSKQSLLSRHSSPAKTSTRWDIYIVKSNSSFIPSYVWYQLPNDIL